MTSGERSLLTSVLEAIGDLQRQYPTRQELEDVKTDTAKRFDVLDRQIEKLHVALEDVRKNAKGANTWAKIAPAFLPVAGTLLTIGAKAVGLL